MIPFVSYREIVPGGESGSLVELDVRLRAAVDRGRASVVDLLVELPLRNQALRAVPPRSPEAAIHIPPALFTAPVKLPAAERDAVHALIQRIVDHAPGRWRPVAAWYRCIGPRAPALATVRLPAAGGALAELFLASGLRPGDGGEALVARGDAPDVHHAFRPLAGHALFLAPAQLPAASPVRLDAPVARSSLIVVFATGAVGDDEDDGIAPFALPAIPALDPPVLRTPLAAAWLYRIGGLASVPGRTSVAGVAQESAAWAVAAGAGEVVERAALLAPFLGGPQVPWALLAVDRRGVAQALDAIFGARSAALATVAASLAPDDARRLLASLVEQPNADPVIAVGARRAPIRAPEIDVPRRDAPAVALATLSVERALADPGDWAPVWPPPGVDPSLLSDVVPG